MKIASVFDTAKYILEQSGTMSTMKLQKLCYSKGRRIAQGGNPEQYYMEKPA